jgi:hypothetical protein
MDLFDDSKNALKQSVGANQFTWVSQQFKYKWHDFKYFMIAFAYHMIMPYTSFFTSQEEDILRSSEKRAKALYKKAIRRSECPLGAFNMLVSIYLRQARQLKSPQE